jgi:CO/xanthine dehydrogenase Mo-binding subunit
MVVGGLVDRAAKQLKDKLAAGEGKDGSEVSVMLQYEPPPGIHFDDATYTGAAYPCYGWAACLVDVSVDVDTYEVHIDRCVQAVDVGKAINPVIVKGQIDGGTLQALGWAVLENVVYKDGKVANANMTNCIVPTFADAPDLETILVEVPYPFGPGGAKGVGEIPMDGPAAAVANAVEDALGCAFDALPISPEAVAASKPRWSIW